MWGVGSPTSSDGSDDNILGLAGTVQVPPGTKKIASMRAKIWGEVWATGAAFYAGAYASVGMILKAAPGKKINGGSDNLARQRIAWVEVEHVGPNPIPVYTSSFTDQLEHAEFAVEWTAPPDVGTVHIGGYTALWWGRRPARRVHRRGEGEAARGQARVREIAPIREGHALSEGQRQFEGRATTGGGAHRDRTVVGLHDLA
jgi:hypothetical protein